MMNLKNISLLFSSIVALALYDQAKKYNFPLGLSGGSIIFLLSAYYCLFQVARIFVKFSKELNWGRFSLILASPILLTSIIIVLFIADGAFQYETLFSDQDYQIISRFAPVSGGNSMYWVLKRKSISRWKASDMQYGRTEEFMPKVIRVYDHPALIRDYREEMGGYRMDTILLK